MVKEQETLREVEMLASRNCLQVYPKLSNIIAMVRFLRSWAYATFCVNNGTGTGNRY